ncbi:hypothetical protein Pse7367_1544 [Thalassoporum mexicanum PCC 7367]|uniref:hypothetical protein n=1 Tax=Thalassoporum mexicanum TaxID=3457544 RepID=UPI00029FC6D5|nr:hypothetical protein [Pseudanabaena sp. PCC 7367]AFY69833.1 hypothetical protein Pse7367_1544 [Pseudanabaena sp. PCC 7367]
MLLTNLKDETILDQEPQADKVFTSFLSANPNWSADLVLDRISRGVVRLRKDPDLQVIRIIDENPGKGSKLISQKTNYDGDHSLRIVKGLIKKGICGYVRVQNPIHPKMSAPYLIYLLPGLTYEKIKSAIESKSTAQLDLQGTRQPKPTKSSHELLSFPPADSVSFGKRIKELENENQSLKQKIGDLENNFEALKSWVADVILGK